MEASVKVEFYSIIGGPENVPECKFVHLRCILAKGNQRNCALGDGCKKLINEMDYKLAGDAWVCKSCEEPFGSKHSPSCGIGGRGAW